MVPETPHRLVGAGKETLMSPLLTLVSAAAGLSVVAWQPAPAARPPAAPPQAQTVTLAYKFSPTAPSRQQLKLSGSLTVAVNEPGKPPQNVPVVMDAVVVYLQKITRTATAGEWLM